MHITLTGNLGSGKSTICRLLEQQYGYEVFSTGKVIRQIADDLNISVLEMNELMSKDHKYDHMIDDKTAQISRENQEKSILFDSRLAWHFVEKSFKVFLSVDLAEAARRVYADASRGEVESYKSEADAAEQLAARAANEDARYEELYGIHYFDFDNYNLILDSSYAKPEVIAALLMQEAVSRAEEQPEVRGRMLISPKRLGFVQEGGASTESASPENAAAAAAAAVQNALSAANACSVAPGIVTVKVEGNRMTVVSGADIVQRAADGGYAYVAAQLAKD
ncbi:MAG: dephospho-CoA kinase [Lachnospiraceae bacterium]|nr:dephospho-CoA kinase [Lachnospiraceae bacterium]